MNLLRLPAWLWQRVLDSISIVLQAVFLRDRRYYHGQYFGTDKALVLGIKNLIRPKRIVRKFLYGQVGALPPAFSLATPVADLASIRAQWAGYIEDLKRDGIVFIPPLLADTARNLRERYRVNPQAFPPTDSYTRFTIDLNDPDIFRVATDPMLLGIFAGYYDGQPYLRHLPGINCTHPDTEKARESVGFNNFWHYDTVNLMTAHLLLSDVTGSDSCMFYAKGSHRTHRVYLSRRDYYYSEQYMRDHYEIVPCIGPAGTLVIFDPNGLHRVDLKPRTFRAHLHLNYVPGNNVLKLNPDIQSGFAEHTEAELTALTLIQQRSLAHTQRTDVSHG